MNRIPASFFLAFLGTAALAGQSLTVTAPKAGDQLCRGREYAVTWTSAGAVGAKVVIRLRQGTVRSDLAVTENDGSWTWSVPPAQAPGTYSILVRSSDGSVTGYSPDFVVADCASPAPAVRRAPPFARPLPIAFPPQPRITEFTMDKPTTFFRLNARNFGGALKQDAQVVLLLGSKPVLARPWPKGQETFAAAGRLFSNDGSPHLESCTQIGGGDYCLRAEIRSPEIQGFPYPGMVDLECAPCWQDLAVSGFQWKPTGELIFSVGNLGYCPSCAWSYRLYRMGELVETSARYGSVAPGAWSQITAKFAMPGRGGGSCLFKVELVPDSPGLEKNTANNVCEVRALRDALEYDVVISDIKLSGEVEYWEFLEDGSPTTDAYNRLVPMLKNTGNKEYPPFTVRVQVAFDDGPVEERVFTIAIAPHEEVPLSHSRWGVRMPVLPVGTHTVRVGVSVCPAAMKKTMTRPQG